jgi:voltage-gated sodium channel
VSGVSQRCARLVASPRFDGVMLCVILANAVVLGLETYEQLDDRHHDLFRTLNEVFLGVFVVELLIRLTAVSWRPRAFFGSGWNTFDFLVVTASFVPGLRENATLLRILRLLRIVRAVRFLPDLRIIISAVGRSIPGVASLAAATVLLLYVYGMIGWVIFDDHDPANFGSIGQAMITMFVLLTLENLPTYIEKGQELSDWTIVFFVSYVLTASFLVFNLFIGIVLNSMEEARAQERRLQEQEHPEERAVREHLATVRAALDELERELDDRRSRDAAVS